MKNELKQLTGENEILTKAVNDNKKHKMSSENQLIELEKLLILNEKEKKKLCQDFQQEKCENEKLRIEILDTKQQIAFMQLQTEILSGKKANTQNI